MFRNYFSMIVFCGIIFITASIYPQNKNSKTLYQTSPIISLMKGVMNDEVTIGELKQHGNLGLGTFNGVNGEMIVLNGNVFRVNNLGKVNEPADSVKTPFAAVVNFTPNQSMETSKEFNFKQIKQFINSKLPSTNSIYAIKVSGLFNSITTRSEAKQTKPYTDLVSVLKNQNEFKLKNQQGTMVGFIFPKYLSSVNAAGYHFHFINDAHNAGGHVVNFTTQKVKIEIEQINNLDIRIPGTKQFEKSKLN